MLKTAQSSKKRELKDQNKIKERKTLNNKSTVMCYFQCFQ
jgi:hypothetical protein